MGITKRIHSTLPSLNARPGSEQLSFALKGDWHKHCEARSTFVNQRQGELGDDGCKKTVGLNLITPLSQTSRLPAESSCLPQTASPFISPTRLSNQSRNPSRGPKSPSAANAISCCNLSTGSSGILMSRSSPQPPLAYTQNLEIQIPGKYRSHQRHPPISCISHLRRVCTYP